MPSILSQEEIDALLEVVDDEDYKNKLSNSEKFLEEINPLNFSNFLISSIEGVIEGLTGEGYEFQLLGDKSFKSECQIIFDEFEIHLNGDFMIYVTEKTLAGEFSKRELDGNDYDMMREFSVCLVNEIKDIFTKKFENSLDYKTENKTAFIDDKNNLFVYRCKKDNANLMIGIYVKNIKAKPKENIDSINEVMEILENGQVSGTFKNGKIKYNLNDIKKIMIFLKNYEKRLTFV